VEDGWIENVYRLQLMNATEAPQQLSVDIEGLAGLQLSRGTRVSLGPAEARWVTVALRLPPEAAQQLKPGAQPVRWLIRSEGGDSVAEKSTFVVPR
jgi:polyferredoxin